MDDVLTQEVLDSLTGEFNCKPETALKIYKELVTKKCVIEDASDVRLLNCLYDVLLEKSMQISHNKAIKEGQPYYATNDYIINKALLSNYEERSFPDLSEDFIRHSQDKMNLYRDNSIKEDSHKL